MKDTVFIRELRIDTVIGLHDWERQIRQTIVLNLEMAWDNRPAAADEAIDKALDYDAVSQRLIRFIGDSEFLLIETLAERVAELLLAEFGIPWLRLEVCKPGAVPEAQTVGVRIERGQR